MNDLENICDLLGLSDCQINIVEILSTQKSLSKSKKNLLRDLFYIQPNADFVDAEINQLIAFGLLKLVGKSANIRVGLIRSFWEIELSDVEVIVKLTLEILLTLSDLDFDKLVNKIRHNLNKYKLTSNLIAAKSVKAVITCILISTKKWGIVDTKVVRAEPLKVTVQNNLFDQNYEIKLTTKNNAISSFKANTSQTNNERRPNMQTDTEKIIVIASQILSANKAGLHVDEIANEAVLKNTNMGLDANSLASKLSQVLSINVNSKTPTFTRVLNKDKTKKRGYYKLRMTRLPTVSAVSDTPTVDTSYFGKAGEYAVLSELLFWGYNVSSMAVDQGVDLVASKNGKYFHFQVKTATPQSQPNGVFKYQFSVKEKIFSSNHDSTMWYVFVLRKTFGNDYVVIPSTELQTQRNRGNITGQDFSIKITIEDKGRKYLMSGNIDINAFVNKFLIV